MKIENFFSELKRRNVYKVAVAYAVVAWLLIQAASIVLPTFEAPAWTMKVLIAALAIGFPIAILFAWAFEITPEGIKLEKDVDPGQSITHQTGRKLAAMTVVLAVIAAGLLLFQFIRARSTPMPRPAASAARTEVATVSQKSIAVLPFENLSRDPDNAYFVDGTQDEILTRLAKISALKVISRTSTTRYASHPDNLRQIARELGVANILEGSVQRAEGAVRVNVQLIEAETDSHLWAETYDRDIKNIFSVESEIAQNVADALRARLLPEETARVANVPTKNPEAYDLFLKAEYFANQFYSSSTKNTLDTVQRATGLYENAVAADADFALAYARLSYLKARVYWYNIDPSPQVIDAAQKAADRALALQPALAEAHLAMGYVHYWGHRDYEPALAEFEKARASLPNNATVLGGIAYVHRRQARMEEALHELEKNPALDPRDNQWPREIGSTFVYMGRYAEAEAAYNKALALVPEDFESQVDRAIAYQMSGDLDGAGRTLAAIPPGLDPDGTVSVARAQLALVRREPDAALAALERAPTWVVDSFPSSRLPANFLRAQALLQKGDSERTREAFLLAQRELESLLSNSRVKADAQSYLARVYAALGQKEAALEAGRRATDSLPVSRDDIVGSFYLTQLAMAEAQVDEKKSALDHIEQLLAIPSGHAISRASLRLDPVWDPIRNDSRFQKLSQGQP
jgi:TolB-like protein/predicted Zn-dependent protease